MSDDIVGTSTMSDDEHRVGNRSLIDNGLNIVPVSPERPNGAYRVFISYGSADGVLVNELLVPKLKEAGATVFLDFNVEHGDDFHDQIFTELARCHELCVLLTPTSVLRPWVFAEIGAATLRKLWIVALVYGVSETKLQSKGITSLLGTHRPVTLDHMPRYVLELKRRIARHSHVHGD
jgi:hypothetical protein